MATYTAVLVVSNELDQDYVIEQLERIGVVAFCGPGSLVQDIDPDDEGNLRLGSRAEAERLADETGRPVRWRGGTVQPDYRPGHTRI